MAKPPIPDAVQQRIVEMFESGFSRSSIQVETGITQPTIRKILKSAGYAPKTINDPAQLTDSKVQQIVTLRNQGFGPVLIAREVGVSKRTVLNVIKEHVEGIKSTTSSPVSAHAFIKAWQESAGADEVALKLGITVANVLSRAYNYRLKGVPLKRFARGDRYDWDELREFAELFLDEDIPDSSRSIKN
jgi:hypothetical protein